MQHFQYIPINLALQLCYLETKVSNILGLMDKHVRRKIGWKTWVSGNLHLGAFVSDHILVVFCLSRLCSLSVIIRTEAVNTFCRGEWQGVFGESAGTGNHNRDNLRTSEPLMGIVFHYCNHRCIMMWSCLVALSRRRLRLCGDIQLGN